MSCKLFYLKKINQVVLSHTFVTFDIQKRGKKTYKLTLLSSKVLINPKKWLDDGKITSRYIVSYMYDTKKQATDRKSIRLWNLFEKLTIFGGKSMKIWWKKAKYQYCQQEKLHTKFWKKWIYKMYKRAL